MKKMMIKNGIHVKYYVKITSILLEKISWSHYKEKKILNKLYKFILLF